ncbi:MAG: SBBP repeat-containing protein [Desulfobacteraceae bacterium]|nr:SBBP repeat-containing protein [Desulfobacteraceae bacterium]
MKTRLGLSVLTAIFLLLFSVSFLAVSGATPPEKADKESTLKAYSKLPLYFIENKGQLDPKVRFYVKTSGQTLYFTDEGIVFDLLRGEKETGKGTEVAKKSRQTKGVKTERLVFNLGFENAREGILIEGLDRQDARINYFVGNDRNKWKRGIPTYKGVVYKGVYKGIDLKIFGNGKDIEYEFIVNPGGNPGDILLTYNGIEGIATNGEGELLIATAFGELKETRPYIYQEIEGERSVDGSFEIRSPASQSQTRKFSYGFQVASYNPSYPLIIDPTLSYSTYLGGSSSDAGTGIAVDSSGNAYLTGYTNSTNFPTQNPYQGTFDGDTDAFVTKLTSSGSALSYSTYLGGSSSDRGLGISVDSLGNAYVTGRTNSTNFPTQNPYQETTAGDTDAFITKLSSSGSALSYSTYLGGGGSDFGDGIAVDGSGNAYITGRTHSTDFPTQDPYQGTNAGDTDAFITKLSSSGSALSYSTYLGGSDIDVGTGIAVDGSGNAYITGITDSTNFPTQNPYQRTYGGYGWSDAFITKLSPTGDALSYSTYLGGRHVDSGNGIAVDDSGNAYVIGTTTSHDFPIHNAYQGNLDGSSGDNTDVFITKLSSSGSSLSYSTYLGGTGWDYGYGIAVDSSGNAYVTGHTGSSDFPTQNPYQGTYAGDTDAFITKLSTSGSSLSCSTYMGGSDSDYGHAIAVDGSGNAYVTGFTYSTNFPTQNPYQETYAGNADAFVTKLDTVSYSYVSISADCGEKTPCYNSIQDAIDAATTGAAILIAQGDYTESIVLNESKSLILQGGWDSTFTTQSSYTTVSSMTISEGTIEADKIILQ